MNLTRTFTPPDPNSLSSYVNLTLTHHRMCCAPYSKVVSELKAVASRYPEIVDMLAAAGVKLPGPSRAGSEASDLSGMGGGGGGVGMDAGARTVQFSA
jgi:hypothetical protein